MGRNVKTALFAILIAVHFTHADHECEAQLVVGSSTELSAKLACLAGSAVQVEALAVGDGERIESRAFNHRACHLRDSANVIVVDAKQTPWTQFWVQRLREQGVTVHCVSTEGRFSTEADVLVRLHEIMVARFPEHSHEFDVRLQAELLRLRQVSPSASLAGKLESLAFPTSRIAKR